MRYIDRASGSALAPKILGTYEKELHPIIERIIATPYSVVLDVGAAEGYYAVGLALKLPHASVEAYDLDAKARSNLSELARLNEVTDRVRVHGSFDFEELQEFAGEKCLVVCDIEGAELDLLRPDLAPALRGFDVLVEIHDGEHSTRIHDALAERFASSHDLEFVRCTGRTLADCSLARSVLRAKNKLEAVDEMRTYGIEWGYFSSHASSGATGHDH
jgi:hypothetical protein